MKKEPAFQRTVDDSREPLKGIVKTRYRGRGAFAISREVWGKDVISICKNGNEIAEHMRRRWKAVQEQ